MGAPASLMFYRYRIELVLERALLIPAHQRAVLFRGAFGAVFRSLVCHDVRLACETCPLRTACPFPRVFAPPSGRLHIARLRDPPRPFVLGDPHPEAPSLEAGSPIALGFTLIGGAVVDLPYFVVAFKRLGDEGLGRDRTRFRVEAVRCVDAAGLGADAVYERGSDLVRPRRLPLNVDDLTRPGDSTARRVSVRFMTPTDLRGGGQRTTGGAPEFGVLVRRARDRASALATFFGDGGLVEDPRAVGVRADTVREVGSEVERTEMFRRSARTGERHSVGGVVGRAVYEGKAIGEVMPWLRLAEALGVGKHATFGNGRIGVEVLA